MTDKEARCTLRIDRLLFKKFKYIARSQGRSINKQIGQYIKNVVERYEEKNGEIKFDDEKQ